MDFIDLGADDDRLADWHRINATASHHGRTHASPMAFEEVRAALAHPIRRTREDYVLGFADGVPVAAGHLVLPLLDNLGYAGVEVLVDPDRQRQGHGSAMLAELERRAMAAARTVIDTEFEYPLGYAADGDWPAIRFAEAHGYRLVQEEIQRTLEMPVSEHDLDRLEAVAREAHGGYRIETWVGHEQPEAMGHAVAALEATLVVEAPSGDRTDLEPEAVDPEADRESQAQMAAQRRTRVRSVAVAPDGDVVAYSDLVVPEHDPGRSFQWGTLVRPDHRGHRLGLATKVATLRSVQRHFPDVRSATTWNAASNDHMIAINEQLGYRVTEMLATWEKRLTRP